DRRAVDVLRVVADFYLDALAGEAFHIRAFGLVGAAHAIAEIGEHFGDAAHADAADADDMDGAEGGREFHGRVFWPICAIPATRMTSSASRSAASTRPAAFAAAAMAESRAGSPKSRASSSASRSAVRSDCRIRIAPPAAASAEALANWSWSSACGSGTRIDGRPITVSSA